MKPKPSVAECRRLLEQAERYVASHWWSPGAQDALILARKRLAAAIQREAARNGQPALEEGEG